jgi:hypothetical protein
MSDGEIPREYRGWWRIVETSTERGAAYLAKKQAKTELARIDSEMKLLRAKLAALEARRANLGPRSG